MYCRTCRTNGQHSVLIKMHVLNAGSYVLLQHNSLCIHLPAGMQPSVHLPSGTKPDSGHTLSCMPAGVPGHYCKCLPAAGQVGTPLQG